MAQLLNGLIHSMGKSLLNFNGCFKSYQIGSLTQQTRTLQLWPDWRMKKDVRKRKALEDNFEMKIRLNVLRRSKVIPRELRDVANEDFHRMIPNDAKNRKIQGRCAITSRPRGNVLRWRLSRIVFRHLSDHNKIAGIQRAMW